MSSSHQISKSLITDISMDTSDNLIKKQFQNIIIIDKNLNNKLIILKKENSIIRKDIFGNEIKKGGKQRVSFIDNPILLNQNLERNLDNINQTINIESYKEYNKLIYKNKEIYEENERVFCESCIIF
jgi:hypothetical protein